MSNNKVTVRKKQLVLPGVTQDDDHVSLLADSMLDIVSWLCTEDKDVEQLVNEVKPKLEAVLRNR